VVLREEPGKKLLHSEDAIQKERACKAEEYETSSVLLAGHFHISINRTHAIDKSLNGNAQSIKESVLPGKNAFHVPAQGLHESSDNCQEQQVLSCAEKIHSSLAKQVK
jgi:hypothetical protein